MEDLEIDQLVGFKRYESIVTILLVQGNGMLHDYVHVIHLVHNQLSISKYL